MRLHGFFRSGASYRLRIALALKGMPFDQTSYVLRHGDQRQPAYLEKNPQGLVPTLELDDGTLMTQSLAILEWLEETHPEPALLPKDPMARARVRAFALAIACDVHPVQNLGVLNAVKALGHTDADVNDWARRVNQQGLLTLGIGGPVPDFLEKPLATHKTLPFFVAVRSRGVSSHG
jgi:maleylpyruvate isomerase